MQISNNPNQVYDTGKIVPVPRELKDRLVQWATPVCKEYDFGTILLQQLITADYRIYITVFSIKAPVILYPFWDKSIVTLQYTREGAIASSLSDQEKILLEASKYHLFYLVAGTYTSQLLPGISESLHIEMGPGYLKELLCAHAPLQKMLNALYTAGKTGQLLCPARINGKVKSIVHEMYQSRKTGHSLHLEMKTQIYRLLCAYDDEITLASNLESIQASKTEKMIIAVTHYITGYPHIHECSLENLSRRFNISPSALKANFKKQSHLSLGDFVQQHCILKAKELLLLGIDPIRDIAVQLGYTDVSNFSRAFRNYMGCSPNEMRLHPEKYKDVV